MDFSREVLGPLGALALAVVVLGFVSRELFRFIREYIASLQATITALQSQLTEALKLLRDQTDANKVLAEAQAARNRDDEMRHRLADAKRGGPTL